MSCSSLVLEANDLNGQSWPHLAWHIAWYHVNPKTGFFELNNSNHKILSSGLPAHGCDQAWKLSPCPGLSLPSHPYPAVLCSRRSYFWTPIRPNDNLSRG